MTHRILYILLAFTFILPINAQIKVTAPHQVAVGEQFRLQYSISTTDVRNFRMGNISGDAFEVLMGPSTSTSQSVSIINGHASQSASVTYTYILCANKNGSFTIPPAHAVVDGKDAASQAVKITVSGSAAPSGYQGGAQQQHQQHQQRGAQVRPSGSKISDNDLFIRVSANKTRVHEQEPVLLTYKVYTQLELTQLEGKMPDLNGFHTQEVQMPQQKSFHMETVNGRPYRCVTWSQYVMYPQMTGSLEIPSITFKGIVVQANTNVDPFEAFFNGGSSYNEVRKDIVAPSVKIQVDPLPTKPADFSGGVGTFSITAALDKQHVKAGDPVNVQIVIGGNGNLKLVKQPELQLPKDFDKYDAKVTDKTQLTANGLSGNMIYDILIVPRNEGKYEIAPLKLTYFDTASSSYKTIQTQSLSIDVEKGDGKSSTVADYSNKEDNDIHPIHESNVDITESDSHFFGSTAYVICNIIVFAAFIVLLILFRQRAIEHANIAGMRGKKANSVATKRLRKAARFMADGKGSEFYDEVLRALWGYVADKFSMPVADLSRENIAEQLSIRSVDQSVIASFIEAIDECEFERYAPGDAAGNMQKTYDTAVTAITNIEDVMKHTKKEKKAATVADNYLHTILAIIATFMMNGAFAANALNPDSAQQIKTNADVAYQKGNYQAAIEQYNNLVNVTADADILYNLGNAYFRTDRITDAIIAYERAQLLNPGDKDIRHNLQIARSKTIDKMVPTESIFFAEWYNSLKNSLSIDTWGSLALISLILSLICFLIYLFVSQPIVQRLSFYTSFILVVVFLFGNLFAWQQSNYADNYSGAIVTASDITGKKTPGSQAADAFVIHEGTHVDIMDTSIKGWYHVRLFDGREGWIIANTVTKIHQ